jgi:O-antigen/teichoic acid export membrane protein
MGKRLNRLTSPFAKTLGSNVFNNIIGAITGILIARLLGPEGKGDLSAITTWPGIFAWIISFSLALGNTYFLAQNLELKDRLYTNSILASLVLSIAGFAILWFALPLLLTNYPADIVLTTQILSSSLLSGILTDYLLGLLQAKGYYGWIASLRLFVFAGNLFIVILFALVSIESSIKLAIGYYIVTNLVTILALAVTHVKLKPRFQPDFSLFKQTFSYSIKAHLGNFAGLFNARLDMWLVIVFLSSREVGWYSVAITVSYVAMSVTTSLSYILFPKVAEQNQVKGRETVLKTLATNTIAQLLICGLIGLAAPVAVPLVFGPGFSNTVILVEILLFGILFQSGAIIIISGLRGLGYPMSGTISEVFSLVSTVGLLAVFLPALGYIGAAIGSTLSYIVNFIVCWFLLEKRYPGSGKLVGQHIGEQFTLVGQLLKVQARTLRDKLSPGKL